MARSLLIALSLVALGAASVAAQRDSAPVAPYAAFVSRAVKALSADDLERLREGEGMGLALAAELNHYPGPKHLLELADSLGLDPPMRRRVERIREAMTAEARRLGARIIALEAELDRSFAARTIGRPELRRLTAELGRLQGSLRAVHLEAHLAVADLLTEEQIRRYDALRGYLAGHRHTH
jgi:hypothetical protein